MWLQSWDVKLSKAVNRQSWVCIFFTQVHTLPVVWDCVEKKKPTLLQARLVPVLYSLTDNRTLSHKVECDANKQQCRFYVFYRLSD